MNANIRQLGAWIIYLIWSTWCFLNLNTCLASTIYLWTTYSQSSGLCPGTMTVASSSATCYLFNARITLHPPWLHATSLSYPPMILLNILLYLRLYASLYIPQLHIFNMAPMASPVRNYWLQKNQDPHLERALLLHSWRQPILIAHQLFELQPFCTVLEIANLWAIIQMNEDDVNTTQEVISDGNSKGDWESTVSCHIEENNLDNQHEILHLGPAYHY